MGVQVHEAGQGASGGSLGLAGGLDDLAVGGQVVKGGLSLPGGAQDVAVLLALLLEDGGRQCQDLAGLGRLDEVRRPGGEGL